MGLAIYNSSIYNIGNIILTMEITLVEGSTNISTMGLMGVIGILLFP